MRERRKVAAGPHAAARRHDRVHPGVEHPEQQVNELGAYPGEPDRQAVGAQQQHRPHDLGWKRIAHARRVRADQVALQLGGLPRLDPHIGQVAEPRSHAVDRLTGGNHTFDDRS